MDYAYRSEHARVYPLLLRAGSELPQETPIPELYLCLREDPYLGRILDAGSFKNYERAHLTALNNTLSPKLAHLLPPELVRKVVRLRVTPSTRRPLDACDHAGRVLPARRLLPLHGGEDPRDRRLRRSILCG